MDETNSVVGIIEEVLVTEGENSKGNIWIRFAYKVKKDDGKIIKLTTFDRKLGDKFKEGMKAKFTYKDNTDGMYTYHNILSMEAVDASTVTLNTPNMGDGGLERQRLIVRQSCLSNALKYWEMKKLETLPVEQILKVAEQFENWVFRGDEVTQDYSELKVEELE